VTEFASSVPAAGRLVMCLNLYGITDVRIWQLIWMIDFGHTTRKLGPAHVHVSKGPSYAQGRGLSEPAASSFYIFFILEKYTIISKFCKFDLQPPCAMAVACMAALTFVALTVEGHDG
jgi:hypothetical protein